MDSIDYLPGKSVSDARYKYHYHRNAEEARLDAHPEGHLAALPPAVQRSREMEAILTSPELYDLLGPTEMIDSIEKTEEGYLVRTSNFYVEVTIVYLRDVRKIGPVEFRLEFSDPVHKFF